MNIVLADFNLGDGLKDLSKSLSDWSPESWNFVTNAIGSVTLKIGLYILLFFLIAEIAGIVERANTNSNGTIQPSSIIYAVVKFLMAGSMAAGSLFLLFLISQIAVGGMNMFNSTFPNMANTLAHVDSVDFVTTDNFMDFLTNLGKIGSFFASLLGWLLATILTMVAGVAMWVIIMSRYMELYVLTALAPIPLASLASSEYKHIGQGFIKYYCAVCFQSVVLGVIFGIYNAVQNQILSTADTALKGNGFNNALAALLFLVMMIGSRNYSKKLFGAN